MSYSIAFISPYKKLADLFSELCSELNKNISIEIGDLEAGVQKALELEKKGYDAVISRGGTSIAIKKSVEELPVVDIPISGFDLMRILYYVKKDTSKIALVGFEPFTHGIEGFGEMLDLDLRVFTLKEEWYDDTAKIKEKILAVQKQGYQYVVGDNISVKISKELGMKSYLIKSGKETLVRAIIEAENVARARRKEMEKTKRVKSIINSAHEGIISIDRTGIIDIFNPRAEVIFNKEAYKVIGKNITTILPEINLLETAQIGYKVREKIWTIGEKRVAANVTPIEVGEEIVGVVATCQEVSRIQEMEQKIRKELYLKGHVADNTFADIIGDSSIIKNIIEEARDYAQIDSPLLIYGETGTGKELFAQAVHNASPRKKKPFVAFNCAAIPENLLESELFGYVKGAFTGAVQGKAGLFEQAHEGTIFLDEIGEVSSNIQVRLLRVLQEQKVRRIGDDRITPINVRVIVATNKNLHQLVDEREFRKDLFYRINVLNLNLPSLRQRREDIPLLANYFLNKYKYKLKKETRGVTRGGMEILTNYEWPGNIRQLENAIERLIIRAKDDYITTVLVQETVFSLQGNIGAYQKSKQIKTNNDTMVISLDKTLEEIEKIVIEEVIKKEKGNKSTAAKRLGIGRTTLWRKTDL